MYIAIEGVIGVGKTTLARMLQPRFEAEIQLEVFEEIRRLTPWDIQPVVTLGEIYLSLGRPVDAAEVFRELWSHQPNQRVVYSFLVDSLIRAGQTEEAEEGVR